MTQPQTINVFQMDYPKGTLFHTSASLTDPMKPHWSWKGTCVAVFKCTIKKGVKLRRNGFVRYVPKTKH